MEPEGRVGGVPKLLVRSLSTPVSSSRRCLRTAGKGKDRGTMSPRPPAEHRGLGSWARLTPREWRCGTRPPGPSHSTLGAPPSAADSRPGHLEPPGPPPESSWPAPPDGLRRTKDGQSGQLSRWAPGRRPLPDLLLPSASASFSERSTARSVSCSSSAALRVAPARASSLPLTSACSPSSDALSSASSKSLVLSTESGSVTPRPSSSAASLSRKSQKTLASEQLGDAGNQISYLTTSSSLSRGFVRG